MDSDEIGVIRRQWIDDEQTRKLAEETRQLKAVSFNSLMNACVNSDDPHVIKAKAKYDELGARMKMFETGQVTPDHRSKT